MKQCTKCGETKPLGDFHRCKREKDGRQFSCKACKRAAYEANRERELARVSNHYRQNRERILVYAHQYRLDNLEKIQSYQRQYRKDNIERVKEKDRRYRVENRERLAAGRKQWALRNPDKERQYRRTHRQGDAYRVAAANRNARRRMKTGDYETDGHTIAILHAHWEMAGRDRRVCSYCDGPISNWKTSVGDHAVPLARGGTDLVENIVPCCPPCNRSKSDKVLFDEWVPPNMRLRNVS